MHSAPPNGTWRSRSCRKKRATRPSCWLGTCLRISTRVFSRCKRSLFPSKSHDLETDCSCPDWASPCKHVAAMHYVLGEAFDRDPFLLFELRGRTRDQVLAALSRLRSGTSDAVLPEHRAAESVATSVEVSALALCELRSAAGAVARIAFQLRTAANTCSDIAFDRSTTAMVARAIARGFSCRSLCGCERACAAHGVGSSRSSSAARVRVDSDSEPQAWQKEESGCEFRLK